MKKLKYVALLALILAFGSCGDDDDGDNRDCRDCVREEVNLRICNNGNGTADVTIGGDLREDQLIPDGVTFDEFVDITCNPPQ